MHDKGVADLARTTLIERLPKLTPEDRELFTADQLDAFNHSLSHQRDYEYLNAALVASKVLGNRGTILPLEKLVESNPPKRQKGSFEQAQGFARMALPDIRMRLASEVIDRTEAQTEEIRTRTLDLS